MAAFFPHAGRRGSAFTFFALLFALLLAPPLPVWGADRKFRTVVIDPGHGGFDRGGIPGQRVAEKTMALDVAQRLAKTLRHAGYRVVMTRDSDVFVSLGQRVLIANNYHDAIFVCVHFNSATRVGANGIETYYYSTNSASLAASVHRHLIGETSTDNRGIRRRGYYVLRRTDIPAVLVECGFLTNPDEARLALQSSYRQKLADAIADGVMGKPTPPNRPVVAGLSRVVPPIRQPFREANTYHDFVRAEAERRPTHRRSHHSTRKKSSSSKKKKSSTSSSKKKKKKADSDE